MLSTCVEAGVVSPECTEELVRSVQNATNRQVQGLRIDRAGGCVTVSGKSRSFYVKQLATQAIRSMAPTLRLQNDIHVSAH